MCTVLVFIIVLVIILFTPKMLSLWLDALEFSFFLSVHTEVGSMLENILFSMISLPFIFQALVCGQEHLSHSLILMN